MSYLVKIEPGQTVYMKGHVTHVNLGLEFNAVKETYKISINDSHDNEKAVVFMGKEDLCEAYEQLLTSVPDEMLIAEYERRRLIDPYKFRK